MGDFGMGAGYDPDFSGPDIEPTYDLGASDYQFEDPLTGVAPGDLGPDMDTSGDFYDESADGDYGGNVESSGGFGATMGALVPVGSAALGKLATSFSLGGPKGLTYNSGGSMPAPIGTPGALPPPGTGRTPSILAAAARAVGKRISAKAIVRFIVKYGWAMASGATGLGAQDLLYLFTAQKMRPRRRRGPHLYTVLKRIRTGHRYEKMLAQYASKAHVVTHRRHANVIPFRRKHARRR